MTVNKEMHPRRYIDRLFVSRIEQERGLIGCKMSVKAEGNNLEWYVSHHIELLIAAVKISNTVPSPHRQKNLRNKIMRKG